VCVVNKRDEVGVGVSIPIEIKSAEENNNEINGENDLITKWPQSKKIFF
jgi:hypothetical protein